MSVPVTTPATEAPAQAPATVVPATPAIPEPDPAAAPAQETDWKAEARKWEDRSKANAEAAKKLADIEESQKTEAQKMADRLAAAEKKATEAERKAYAAQKGIPAELVTGSTEAEWEAAATTALAWKGTLPALPVAPSAEGQGKVGSSIAGTVQQVTEAEFDRMTPEEINKARREGRLKNLL